ncbi:MAG: hypothetical protein HQ511_04650 [Rhodospirillales bacterium]|nr:hypothetical protein [Rhodospirillales bacterium]
MRISPAFQVFAAFLCASTWGASPATGGAVEKLAYEETFGDWTATVVNDLVLSRNNCRLSTAGPNGDNDGSGGTATLHLDLLMRAYSTTWASAAFLPDMADKSEIVLAIDGTVSHELHREHVSSSTAYLSGELSAVLLKDFLTGELLGESITIRYRGQSGTPRAANFSLDGFSEAKKTLEHKCATL